MRNCPTCGITLADETTACPNCGRQFRDRGGTSSGARRGCGGCGIVGCSCLSIVGLIIVLIALFLGWSYMQVSRSLSDEPAEIPVAMYEQEDLEGLTSKVAPVGRALAEGRSERFDVSLTANELNMVQQLGIFPPSFARTEPRWKIEMTGRSFELLASFRAEDRYLNFDVAGELEVADGTVVQLETTRLRVGQADWNWVFANDPMRQNPQPLDQILANFGVTRTQVELRDLSIRDGELHVGLLTNP